MSAFLTTSKGKVVKAPHFILQCRNCGAPMQARLEPDLATRTGLLLDVRCEGVCGVAEAFKIEPKQRTRP